MGDLLGGVTGGNDKEDKRSKSEKAKGRMKEAAGAVTNDKTAKDEGKKDQGKKAKDSEKGLLGGNSPL